MDKDNQKYYFKYKSLNNIEYFLDIIANKRIYVASYDELNDPSEGYYQFSSSGSSSEVSEFMKKVKGTKSEVRILSLTTSYNNFLMWSHYGDGHKGVCIELQVATEEEPHPIDYGKELPLLDDWSVSNVINVLSHKSPLWKYENEVRYFKHTTDKPKEYIDVKVRSVYFGIKADEHKVKLLTKIINLIDKNIKVKKLRRKDLRATSGYSL